MNFLFSKGFLLLVGLMLLLYTSCNVINPSEEIPSYIRIDSIEVYSSSSAHGSISHKISDAWINIDGNLLGVYELPKVFPVLKNGTHKIMVRPGIKVNGIAASRKWYPFYTQYLLDTNLVQGEVIKIKPRVTYKTETSPSFVENFDGAGFVFDTIFPTEVPFIRTSSTVFEGIYSGYINLPGNKTIFRCKTSLSYDFPVYQSSVYLEMNYKNNIEFYVGIIVNTNTGSSVYPYYYNMRPSSNWNKVYIELTEIIRLNMSANSYNIFIAADKADTTVNGEIFLDNIKLLHF